MTGSPGELPDPYTTLGVARGASGSEIKRAYRRKASETHPDKRAGGKASSAPFQAVQRAYALLASPARRSEYDRTGRDPGPKSENSAREAALRRLAEIFLAALEALDPDAGDIIEAVDANLIRQVEMVKNQMKSLRSQQSKLARAKKLVRVAKGKHNLLAEILDVQISKIDETIGRGTEEMEALGLMREILGDYEWDLPCEICGAPQPCHCNESSIGEL